MRMTDYIDRTKTTAEILRDWRDQQWKAETGRERLAEIDTRLTRVTGRTGGTPVSGGGGNRTEEALAAALTQKEIVTRGYTMARDYLRELTPCWERLSEEERFMLTVRYIDQLEGNGIPLIMEKYHISRSEAYRRSEAALNRLSRLLFW
jgi:hypothetical protein